MALHVQAKAAIPPQGARTVAAIESRSQEGLEQLRRFRELPPTQRDNVISTAVGRSVEGVHVVDVLLARTSFGTTSMWREAQGIALVNLTLLSELISDDPRATLSDFTRRAEERLNEIVSLTNPQWIEHEIDLELAKLRLPILDYATQAIALARVRAWHAVASLPRPPSPGPIH